MTTRQANGSAIRTIRDLVGIRQYDLADRAGITAGYLSLIESGRKQPTLPVLAQIATALGVSLDVISSVVTTCDAGTTPAP